MQILWGIVIVALSLLCWGGQAVVCFAPATGARLGLSEAEANVEPTFWADVRGEALWDVLALRTLVVAGVLLIIDKTAWAYFGLVGGGMYVYFAGRGIFSRVAGIPPFIQPPPGPGSGYGRRRRLRECGHPPVR